MYGDWLRIEYQFFGNSLVTMSEPSAQMLGDIGLDPTWSRFIDVPSADGYVHRWHYLERVGTDQRAPTILCIHGNPTWSFLWSRLFHELDPSFRVIAPDQLSMGFSDHLPKRRYEERVRDIADFVAALEIDGPLWIVAQDWGGAIAMGYTVEHRDKVAGLVLSNTGIAVPAGRQAPRLIRISASTGLHRFITRHSSLFVKGTAFLPGVGLTKQQRRGLSIPYTHRRQRDGVADFVADVPFDGSHPTFAVLEKVAEQLPQLHIPVRLWWGSRDPVFNDDFADDLMNRLADVQIHRVAQAGHLAVLETSIANFVETSIRATRINEPASEMSTENLWSRIADPSKSDHIAIHDGATNRAVTFSELDRRVASWAKELTGRGIVNGDRVAILIPPSIDLIAVVYACWRIGAVTVIADRGLGFGGLGRAIRSSRVQHVIGIGQAVVASRLLRWAPRAQMINLKSLQHAALDQTLGQVLAPSPVMTDVAAILFTSGATGPAKGVRYTHGQLGAQRDALQRVYAITAQDRFVAAFAPFALFGPALGITTGLADMDVTAPATLTATALDSACLAIGATMVFASPAALANVVRSANSNLENLSKVRLVMSAGAPVPIDTLRDMKRLCPTAEFHTPYGMTEVLPVADLSLEQRESIGSGRGVCVGRAVDGCTIEIVTLETSGDSLEIGVTGEVAVSAPWMSLGYHGLWQTQEKARFQRDEMVWHRTGDIGHIDTDNNLWIEGRIVHVIHTSAGPVTPVPLEVACESLGGVERAAAVGIGKRGVQQIVIVVEEDGRAEGPADDALTREIRAQVAPTNVAAVWTVKKLPVDIRHNSKIDRTALGELIEKKLSGSRS